VSKLNRSNFATRLSVISILALLSLVLGACVQPAPAPAPAAAQVAAPTTAPAATAAPAPAAAQAAAPTTAPAATAAPAAAAKQFKVGYIAAGTEEYYACQQSGVEKKAKELGVNLVELNSGDSADKELSNMEDMISKQVDMILLMTTNGAAGQKALQLANKANIPVILAGVAVQPGVGKAASLIDFDFIDMGRSAGEWVAKNVPEGEVAIVEGLAGMNVAEPITQGFKEKLAANPKLTVVAAQPADWSRQKAQDITTNLLQAHPNLKVIYGHNDDMSLGIIKAVQAANKQGQVIVVSNNASPEGVAAIKAGTLTGSVAQAPASAEGERSVQLAVDFLSGKQIPNHERETLMFLTKDNLDQAKPWCYK
jgi:ribose transport system substrate-binding protein